MMPVSGKDLVHLCLLRILFHFSLEFKSILQGFTVADRFFTKEEIEPCIQSYARLIDDLAQRLYKTGRIKSKVYFIYMFMCYIKDNV